MPTREIPARTSLSGAAAHIAARDNFDANGTFSGHNAVTAIDTAELPLRFHSDLNRALQAPDFYLVVSYATPIAWFAEGIWYVPNVFYSHATPRHQSSLGLLGDAPLWRDPAQRHVPYAYVGDGVTAYPRPKT